jgi:hypothetical protein
VTRVDPRQKLDACLLWQLKIREDHRDLRPLVTEAIERRQGALGARHGLDAVVGPEAPLQGMSERAPPGRITSRDEQEGRWAPGSWVVTTSQPQHQTRVGAPSGGALGA